MDNDLIKVAYAALLHDIGQFYQRTFENDNLTKEELEVVTKNSGDGSLSHLHSGYTARFLKENLGLSEDFWRLSSSHHSDDPDRLARIIRKADEIASKIDLEAEQHDTIAAYNNGRFLTARLHSVLSEVDFGKPKKDMVFPLYDFAHFDYPKPAESVHAESVSDSVEEYKKLFRRFAAEVDRNPDLKGNVTPYSYNIMYNILRRHLSGVPASTYDEKGKSTVSLFDHLRLTSAIASCLYYKDEKPEDNKAESDEKDFCMLEIDISGIQNFIYQITEGAENKKGLTKNLRGRSILIGLLSNAVSYAFLNEFGLPCCNIIFNSGGGSTILLPRNDDTEQRIKDLSDKIKKRLYGKFQTDVTFVGSFLDLCESELENYQSDKIINLKQELGKEKMKKFSTIIDDDFFFEPISDVANSDNSGTRDKKSFNHVCKLCGRPSTGDTCEICQKAEDISDIYTKHENFAVIYEYDSSRKWKGTPIWDLGFVNLSYTEKVSDMKDEGRYVYADSINDFHYGNMKVISNLVPIDKQGNVLSFGEIIDLTPDEYGDKKLGLLKMDVDNLGGIFAYGLKDEISDETSRSVPGERPLNSSVSDKTLHYKKPRSMSKYVAMSRLFEYFFGHELENICKDVSKDICKDISSRTQNGTMFYINYAGGDDLVIMGSVYSIIVLAQAIHDKFSEYTGNSNITISAGINIQSDRKPVRFGVLEAEDFLEMSKSGEKNAITLLDTTVPFDEFGPLMSDVMRYRGYINGKDSEDGSDKTDKVVSRTMLYNILSRLPEGQPEEESKDENGAVNRGRDRLYDEYVCLVPRIQYTLHRNIDERKYDSQLKRIISDFSNIQSGKDVRKLRLKLKLVMLVTRDQGGQR